MSTTVTTRIVTTSGSGGRVITRPGTGSERKVYSSGGTRGVSGYHLGNAHDMITGNSRPDNAVPAFGQDYNTIKRQLLRDGVLFEDPQFLPRNESLFFSRAPPREFLWKRPKELVDNPKLFVGGASRFDITQGMLGDCWLLAAIASITEYEGLLFQVVPKDQDFDHEYCGMFRFRFWQYGRWEEVVIDDRLPTFNNRLVFVHSADSKEFWTALLEKAYAKLHGSYEALKGGQTSEAMEDFTGGVTETFNLQKAPADLLKIMLKAVARQSLMCCSIEAKANEIEAKLDNGLVKGHAYSVTGVKKVSARSRSGEIKVNLVRIRNPWGNEREWKGAWGDKSPEWSLLSEEEKRRIGLSFDDDGEFWMSFEDFIKEFTRLEVCMLSPDSAGDTEKRSWEMQIQQGSWQNRVSAGGCRNFPDTFHLNPQYKVKLEDPDDDEDVDNCTLVAGLIQKNRRQVKKLGSQNLTIGFAIYRLEEDSNQYVIDDRLSKDFFLYHKSTARSENFVNAREVTGRFSLPPGDYVILPSTFKSGEEGDFILRLFSEKPQTAGFVSNVWKLSFEPVDLLPLIYLEPAQTSRINSEQERSAMDTKTTIEYKPKKINEEQSKEMDTKFKGFFDQIAGKDNEIDAFELQQVMTMAFKKEFATTKEFSLEAARSMVAMTDADRSGKLGFKEFKDLWHTVMQWKGVFKDYDKDKSGDMDAIELRGALSKLGFRLSTPALSSLVLRYCNKKGYVSFDDFLQVCCRIKSCFESYLSYQGKSFTLDDYILGAIYT